MFLPFSPFPQIVGGFSGKYLPQGLHPNSFLMLKQIHGNNIHLIEDKEDINEINGAEGDAILSLVPHIRIAVQTADCVPVLLAHPNGLVGAVHAGWRGTAQLILQKTILFIQNALRLSVKELRLAIGPSICGNCYEVGEEVAQKFKQSNHIYHINDLKYLINLKEINREMAIQNGVLEQNIQTHSECTLCQEGQFFSYRGAKEKNLGSYEMNKMRNYSWVEFKF